MTRAQKGRVKQGSRLAPPPEPRTKHTGRLKLLIGLAVLIAAFTAFVTSGFAEFESENKGDTGTGELLEAVFTEGPTTVTCNQEEGNGGIKWVVEKEGVEQKKASSIRFDIEKWGECIFAAAAGQAGKAELGACEMETKQSGEQTKERVSVINTCKIKIGLCEIKLEPKGNQELEEVEVARSGANEKDTAFDVGGSSMVVAVSSECASFGIQASKAATFVINGLLGSVKTSALALGFGAEPEVPAGNTAIAAHVFKFEKETVTCTETKYEYGAIKKEQRTILVKPTFMPPSKLCKTETNGGVSKNAVITVSETGTAECEFEFKVRNFLGNPKALEFLGSGSLIPSNNTCKIVFKGSAANNPNNVECERVIEGGLVVRTEFQNRTGLNIKPNSKIAWKTSGGEKCGENETNGGHSNTGGYTGTSTIGGGAFVIFVK